MVHWWRLSDTDSLSLNNIYERNILWGCVQVHALALERPSHPRHPRSILGKGWSLCLPPPPDRRSTAGDKSCHPVVGGWPQERSPSRSWNSWMLEAGAGCWMLEAASESWLAVQVWKDWQATSSWFFPGNTQSWVAKRLPFFWVSRSQLFDDASRDLTLLCQREDIGKACCSVLQAADSLFWQTLPHCYREYQVLWATCFRSASMHSYKDIACYRRNEKDISMILYILCIHFSWSNSSNFEGQNSPLSL